MPSTALENFTDEQIAQVGYTLHHISMAIYCIWIQLYELHVEATKPIDAEKDPHLAQK